MKTVAASIFTVVFATFLVASPPVFAGNVTVLAETDYFPATLNAINNAKSDIAMSMYLIQINTESLPAGKAGEKAKGEEGKGGRKAGWWRKSEAKMV